MEQNPFWGEPTPTDLWDDMDKLNELYEELGWDHICLLYTSPSPRDRQKSRMPSSA